MQLYLVMCCLRPTVLLRAMPPFNCWDHFKFSYCLAPGFHNKLKQTTIAAWFINFDYLRQHFWKWVSPICNWVKLLISWQIGEIVFDTNINRQNLSFQDIGFPYKLLIGANKEIELFNVRPSFVSSAPPQQRWRNSFRVFDYLSN